MATFQTSQQTAHNEIIRHDSEEEGSENIPFSMLDLQKSTRSLSFQKPTRNLRSLESSEDARVIRDKGQYRRLTDRISISVATVYVGITCIAVLFIIVITLLILLEKSRKPNSFFENRMYTACPEGWIGFGSKCFHFSKYSRNWTFSESSCASQKANLVQIETQDEWQFVIRYKGLFDHWIGFINETINHNGKPIAQTGCNASLVDEGVGECPYLNDNKVSSGRIYIERKWICSKPKEIICRCQIPLNPSQEFQL